MNRFLLISSISVFFFFCSRPGAQAQCDGTVLNNLTGGNSLHTSAISSTWSKHEWDITFPSQFWGQTLKDVKLWYRLVLTGNVTVNGGFTTGNDGSPVLTFVNANTINSTPPNTSQTDYYLFFDFTGQNLSIPSNGVLWFRFDFVSGYNGREDIGSNTYTSTYQQNDITRSGYTSFAIYADLGFATTQTIMNALCHADSSGSATVSVSGSNPPYSFLWDNNANNQTDSTATGLAAGTYLVTITDSLGCQDVDTVTVGEPPAITSATASTDILCNSDSSGSATVMAGGGTQGYTYAWSDWNNQADTTATGLAAGTYYVTVTDSNGCTLVDTVLLSEPPALTLNIVANDDVEQSCVGNATAFAGGGTPQYTYQWDANAGSQTLPTATGLCEGTYFVTITDANGCVISDSAVIGNVLGTEVLASVARVQVYPNPSKGAFIVKLGSTIADANLVIYNSLGAEVMRKPLRSTETRISGLQPGIYFLQINLQGQRVVRRMNIY